ncbi:MAG: copper amine oxidase N-terminal domain-containing protein [Thermoanaerobacteraceae bacterium]|nr:copper amine oxidase N-terminal domain-containing protein [Thermoanaerobacteraceae bacterium]
MAKYQDYGVTITGKTTEEVIAGRTDQEVGDFYIEEAAPGSLIDGRTLTLKLPANAKWVTEPSVTVEKGNVVLSSWSSVDDRTIKATVTGSTTASKVLLKDAKVKLAVDTAGDLAIEVGGTAGATGSVVVAKVVAPISASAASTPNLKIGEQSQAAGDITITEGKKEAIDKVTGDDLVLEAPTGVEFAAVPTVTVTDGDLVVDKVTKSGRYVYIELKSTSSKASTIKVSDIKYTVDRTVPVGPIELKIKGDGVNKTATDFANATVAAKVVNANCVTPAPGEQKVTTQLTIGNTTMKVNGQDVAMDAAPYIKDGRTMISVRWVAQALGVADENIIWDGANRTVTVMTSTRVVQMKIGSKVMTVNGASITMDVAAEIVPPGRTCIPMRFLAQALGAKVTWDDTTKTAIFEL